MRKSKYCLVERDKYNMIRQSWILDKKERDFYRRLFCEHVDMVEELLDQNEYLVAKTKSLKSECDSLKKERIKFFK